MFNFLCLIVKETFYWGTYNVLLMATSCVWVSHNNIASKYEYCRYIGTTRGYMRFSVDVQRVVLCYRIAGNEMISIAAASTRPSNEIHPQTATDRSNSIFARGWDQLIYFESIYSAISKNIRKFLPIALNLNVRCDSRIRILLLWAHPRSVRCQ